MVTSLFLESATGAARWIEKEALIKAIHGFIRARCVANAVCDLLQNQSLGAIDFAGTSLCRGKV